MSEPQLDENGYQIVPCKIVLVGQSGVGKTNIITKYVSNEFSEDTESTNGASFASKEISYDKLKKTLKMEIWDTAGQEKFRSLTRFFYKDAAIAILVYDITRKDSFLHIPSWINELTNVKIEDIIFALVGNKIDLNDKREISFEEGEKFAKDNNFIFQEVSAKTGENFPELFYNKIFEQIIIKFRPGGQQIQQEIQEIGKVKLDNNNNENENKITKKNCCGKNK